ncbi:MAG: hypothetical protein ACETWK_01985 [Candidatus Aminicenantaceae bacterium]
MQNIIKCPDCGSYNIKEISHKVDDKAGGPYREYPKKVEYIKYECLDCGLQFHETNLRQ